MTGTGLVMLRCEPRSGEPRSTKSLDRFHRQRHQMLPKRFHLPGVGELRRRHRAAVEANVDGFAADGAMSIFDVGDGVVNRVAPEAEEAAHGDDRFHARDQVAGLLEDSADVALSGEAFGGVAAMLQGVAVALRCSAVRLHIGPLIDFIGKTPRGCSAIFRGRGEGFPPPPCCRCAQADPRARARRSTANGGRRDSIGGYDRQKKGSEKLQPSITADIEHKVNYNNLCSLYRSRAGDVQNLGYR